MSSLFLVLPAWFGCGGANETKRYREIALKYFHLSFGEYFKEDKKISIERKKIGRKGQKTRRRSPRPVRRYVCVTTGYKLAQTRGQGKPLVTGKGVNGDREEERG
ncbi:hypothetical protein HZH68_007825 [Vespula germanica]|uniref:Secreted protein n=1 Tax=Vespula germanica TaxID=30212 RepID=A0A834K2V4_VESGE|nr:hypothetical protein HZH68_007825 [Vespula germanica]